LNGRLYEALREIMSGFDIFDGDSVFIAGVTLSDKIGEATHSGMLGICGPYGPQADLVGCIFLGSFPAAIAAGFYSAKFFYRRVSDEHK
jgi:hypothetical protein